MAAPLAKSMRGADDINVQYVSVTTVTGSELPTHGGGVGSTWMSTAELGVQVDTRLEDEDIGAAATVTLHRGRTSAETRIAAEFVAARTSTAINIKPVASASLVIFSPNHFWTVIQRSTS